MKMPRYINWIRNRISIASLGIALVILILLYSCYMVYMETYVWQSTELASYINFNTRKACQYTSNLDKVGLYAKDAKQVKIGIIMLYGKGNGNWNKELMAKVLKNRKYYCSKHDYDLIVANELIDRRKPTAWSKLIAMQQHLKTHKYDYLFYMDMDISIMNFDVKLESFLTAAKPSHDLVMTTDWSGLNTGVWFAKETAWTTMFLDTLWKQDQLVPPRSKLGIPHPFEYEQRAFHYLLQTDIWKKRGLPKYPGNSSELLQHIYFLPQCAFNSYNIHPLEYRSNHIAAQYIPGDFLIHFAGKKGKIKNDLIEHYLDLAEKSMKLFDAIV